MSAWESFYLLTGTAAATLVGLMFIAITFGAKLVTPERLRMTRAILSPIIYHYTHAFIISCAALIPSESATLLAIATIATSLGRLLNIPILRNEMILANDQVGHIERSDWILEIVIPVIIYVLLIVGGIGALRGSELGLQAIAGLVVAIIVLGLYAAWDMLLWMATQVGSTDQ